jgi:hypothetical protein
MKKGKLQKKNSRAPRNGVDFLGQGMTRKKYETNQ